MTLGAGAKGEKVDWGIDLRTQPTGSRTSEWLSNANSADLAVGLGQAYGRFHETFWDTDFALTFGRAKTVVLYDNLSQQLFDNDTRWDGFGWAFKRGIFGLNAAQYVLGSTSQGTAASASSYSYTDATQASADTQSRFAVLYAVQPWVQLKLGEEITSTLALGYLNWSGTGGGSGSGFYSNNVHGGTAGSVGNTNAVIMDNSAQWQVLSDTSFPRGLRLVGELVRNKRIYYGTRTTPASPQVEADRTAWALSLAWGKPKKAGELGFSYTYGSKGIASVVNTFSNGDVSADNQSHLLEGKYCFADGASFAVKAQFHSEKAKLGGDGQPLASPNQNRNQTQKRYELVTSVQI